MQSLGNKSTLSGHVLVKFYSCWPCHLAKGGGGGGGQMEVGCSFFLTPNQQLQAADIHLENLDPVVKFRPRNSSRTLEAQKTARTSVAAFFMSGWRYSLKERNKENKENNWELFFCWTAEKVIAPGFFLSSTRAQNNKVIIEAFVAQNIRLWNIYVCVCVENSNARTVVSLIFNANVCIEFVLCFIVKCRNELFVFSREAFFLVITENISSIWNGTHLAGVCTCACVHSNTGLQARFGLMGIK